jgi:2-dehydropantoate 2-reductase
LAPTWHIIGAGAIGTLLACKLQAAGVAVRLLCRDEKAVQRFAHPIILVDQDAQERFELRACTVADSDPIAHLMICTKANQALAAYQQVRAHLLPTASVTLLHNGMGIYEQVQTLHPASQLYCGSTTHGAFWRDANTLVHAGHGATWLGQPGREQAPVALAPLLKTGMNWEADIEQALWRKLMVNCAINPLTAVHGIRNGELLQQAALADQVQALCEELSAVALALGYADLASGITHTVRNVIEATAANQSSMMRDSAQGRETEIDTITGYLVARAQELGVAVPRNRKLLAQLRGRKDQPEARPEQEQD